MHMFLIVYQNENNPAIKTGVVFNRQSKSTTMKAVFIIKVIIIAP